MTTEQKIKYFTSVGKRGINWNIAGAVIGMSKQSVSQFIARHGIPVEKLKLLEIDRQTKAAEKIKEQIV